MLRILTKQSSPGPISTGLTLVCKKQFNCLNLSQLVTKNDRNPHPLIYAVWIRDGVEADKETQGLSANNLAKKKNVKGITLLERLLFELKYFSETKKSLDLESITLCSGSRCSDGSVPSVCWFADSLYVYCYNPDGLDEGLRSRVVVSL